MLKLTDREPDFRHMLDALSRKAPEHPVLFELFLNYPLYVRLAGHEQAGPTMFDNTMLVAEAYANAGYDYSTAYGSQMGFPVAPRNSIKTLSLNDGSVIHDRAEFEAYAWPDPDAFDYSHLGQVNGKLPGKLKLMVMGPGGVLENVTTLVGYDNLCLMLYDDPELARDIFDAVGSRLVRYYENAVNYDSVGMLMSNDDWGFNTQTFLSVADMRKYVFPWHKKIAEVAHRAGKPILLHSCGNATEIFDDIIDYMKYDGKHSYEDVIMPVEECYRRWGSRIAILGGIDVDFMVRADEEQISKRARALLELTRGSGGYALGSGNSIPEYIPQEHYLAMVKTALEFR